MTTSLRCRAIGFDRHKKAADGLSSLSSRHFLRHSATALRHKRRAAVPLPWPVGIQTSKVAPRAP